MATHLTHPNTRCGGGGQAPKPFIWTAKARHTLSKISRFQPTLNKSWN
jgi:hypothetical protein